MPHLPNEIWLLIIAQCPPADSWRSLRQSNQQLKDCVEQFFTDDILPRITIALPVALPTYDIRNPLKGQAIFHPLSPKDGPDPGRLHLVLVETEPIYYQEHFLGRWKGMAERNEGAFADYIRWEVQLAECGVRTRLYEARAALDCGDDETKMSFEWMPTMTGFFA